MKPLATIKIPQKIIDKIHSDMTDKFPELTREQIQVITQECVSYFNVGFMTAANNLGHRPKIIHFEKDDVKVKLTK